MSCPDCFQGGIMTSYEPTGTLTTIHNRLTYIARPPDGQTPKGIVIIIPDAFGLPFPNNKHLADTYASQGPFLVYLPDFTDGHDAPIVMFELFTGLMKNDYWSDWIYKPYYLARALWYFIPFKYQNGFSTYMPKVQAFFEAVRDNEATEQNLAIGSAGFCWGGEHVFALASGEYKSSKSGKLLCDAHFTAHPSNVVIPAAAKKIKLPFSLAQGTEDKVMTLAQAREVEAILREKAEKEGLKDSEVVYYQGAGHGFGVRADPGNKEVVKHAEDSIKQALDFYHRVFAGWKAS